MKPMIERVSPDLLESVEMIRSAGFEVSLQTNEDLAKFRARYKLVGEQMSASLPPIEGVNISEKSVTAEDGASITVRVYRPSNTADTLPAMLWIHGGGYVIGEAKNDDLIVSGYVKSVGCAVVSVDYRLAPEHPFPVPLNDCYSALKWVFDNSAELMIDPARIAIAGQSAGAGLTAGLAQLARDRNELQVIFQLLIYPMLDDRNILQADETIPDTILWTRANNLFGWRAYLGQEPGTDNTPKYASPGRTNTLEGLPPTYMMIGDLDLFLEENIEYAKRLIRAGVPTDMHIYKGAFHGFDSMAPNSGAAQRANADNIMVLKEALHST